MTGPLKLKYGGGEIALRIPPGAHVEIVKEPGPISEPVTRGDVEKTLDNPLGSPPFGALFSSGETVTIIVPDLTRYCAASAFLPPMLDRLNGAGVPDSAVTILFSNGTHRKMTDKEKIGIVGEDVFKRTLCVDHDAGGDLAESKAVIGGVPVRLNRLAVECGKLVITGAVGLHYLAGFGGGRKAIMPGVASLEDARRFHELSMNPDGPGRHPKARSGTLDGNPMHELATRIMNALGPVFMLNTVVDAKGRVTGLAAGSPEAAFEKGVEMVRARAMAPIKGLADVVVASCGGHPKDINFIQAHKAYDNAVNALRPGGKLFLAARCPDGVGSATFLPWLEYGNAKDMERALRENFQINGQTALATVTKSAEYETALLSGLAPEDVRAMGIRPVESAEQFVNEAEDALAGAGSGIVIPEGGYLLPVLVR